MYRGFPGRLAFVGGKAYAVDSVQDHPGVAQY
jgi:hypothetical protein